MSDKAYQISSLIILLLVLMFPAFQLYQTGGFLFYTNGWDEASYLQYDYAKHVIEIAAGGRAAQFLIILLHDLGLSGGYINLIFDIITSLIILILLPAVLIKAGTDKDTSRNISISLAGVPLLISNINPLFDWLQKANMESNLLKYVTMPFINDPFWLRTPEPQLSIILLLASLYIALTFRNLYIVLAAALISYPFIGVPVFFLVAVFIFLNNFKLSLYRSLAAAFLLASVLLLAYRLIYLSDYMKGYVVLTNIPLLSACGLIGLTFYFLSKKKDKIPLILILSVWFAANFQIISGFTIQPNNFEQYWSAPVLVLVLVVLFKENLIIKKLPHLSLIIFALWTLGNFRINNSYLNKISLNDDLLQDIKSDPSRVAINDIGLSTRLDMLYPGQKPVLFSYTRFYKEFPRIYLNDFLCARSVLKDNHDFSDVLFTAAAIFKNGDKNYVMNTIKRASHAPPDLSLDDNFPQCNLKIYTVGAE